MNIVQSNYQWQSFTARVCNLPKVTTEHIPALRQIAGSRHNDVLEIVDKDTVAWTTARGEYLGEVDLPGSEHILNKIAQSLVDAGEVDVRNFESKRGSSPEGVLKSLMNAITK